jgi:site-specific recombinase XerC
MIDEMQIRNLSPRTQRAYVEQVVQFARHFRQSPEHLRPAEIRTRQLYLAQDRCLAARSITVAVSALRLFYTVTLKRPWVVEDDIPTDRQAKKLPVVLGQDEVARFLGAVDHLKHRMILTVCYATGPRIAIDDTAARRGHDYITLFVDIDRARVLFATEGKDAGTVAAFADGLAAHGGDAEVSKPEPPSPAR